ncbi:hypothetical protein C0993_003730, partial [Termitomyces sp. T159_Od127]
MSVQVAYMAANKSDSESEDEEGNVAPQKEEYRSAVVAEEEIDAASFLIDGKEYVTVDVYDNDYYSHNSNMEHLVAKMEAPKEEQIIGDQQVKM